MGETRLPVERQISPYIVDPYGPVDVNSSDLYNSFANAETGGVSNPWIRTYGDPESSSTAFGPVQITMTKAVDYANRGLISPDSKSFVNTVLLPMYRNFVKYGREPNKAGYDKDYDYGGTGKFDVNKYREAYERLANEMLWADYKSAGYDINNTIKRWRGKDDDNRYNKAVLRAFIGRKK